MQLHEIIQNAADRVFILDHECFLLYTGNDINDSQPFIRFGNWNKLPYEIIPLIDNIVITEKQIGNPFLEQVNCDIANPESNRYVGKTSVFNKFLDQQDILELDLSNAQFTNIGDDTPELDVDSAKQCDNQLLGIFTAHGNFKVIINNEVIFELSKIINSGYNYKAAYSRLTGRTDLTTTKNPALIFSEGSLLLISGRESVIFDFPDNPIPLFRKLKVDPKGISHIIHDKNQIAQIAPYLEWAKSQNHTPLLYSNYDILKKYCSSQEIDIQQHKLKNISVKHAARTSIKQYQNSQNYYLTYYDIEPEHKKMTIALIMDRDGIKSILKDDVDLIVIFYSTYEKSNLLFKSSKIPYVIVEDDNPNFKKFVPGTQAILYDQLHYNLKYTTTIDNTMLLTGLEEHIIYAIVSNNVDEIMKFLNTSRNEEMLHQVNLHNMLNLIKFLELNTTDRSRVASLANLKKFIIPEFKLSMLLKYFNMITMHLICFQKNIFVFAQLNKKTTKKSNSQIHTSEQIDERINSDRERLYNFLSLYQEKQAADSDFRKKVKTLEQAILNRLKTVFKSPANTRKDTNIPGLLKDMYNNKIKTFYNRKPAKKTQQ